MKLVFDTKQMKIITEGACHGFHKVERLVADWLESTTTTPCFGLKTTKELFPKFSESQAKNDKTLSSGFNENKFWEFLPNKSILEIENGKSITFLKLNKESYHYSKVHNNYLLRRLNIQTYLQCHITHDITFFLSFNHNTTFKSTTEPSLEPIFFWMIREMKNTTTIFSAWIPFPASAVSTYNREKWSALFLVGWLFYSLC